MPIRSSAAQFVQAFLIALDKRPLRRLVERLVREVDAQATSAARIRRLSSRLHR